MQGRTDNPISPFSFQLFANYYMNVTALTVKVKEWEKEPKQKEKKKRYSFSW